MSWITHADGTVEPEIHLPIDDLIEFDGSIIDEIKHFKTVTSYIFKAYLLK